ncbi:penicillin-binding protein [Glutamicibacter sp. MNS18]|uniref:transglycosylase domain-containing protein n=1 Tax=Glutamicibacter sp. MNS18 TaxID=2989817 RepID=UPI002235FA11|nr:transglycosylase domain-containing protein [Glutamicibacter sp. MNS18]MCW4463995.1 penicillin-binding protein [Glutamicibacter sp. MNS18]
MTTGNNILNALPASFDKLPIPQPSTVLDSKGKVIATFYEQNRDPVKLEDISPYMRKAIVSVEDERFYEHSGVDPRGIARAAMSNITSTSRQGASTLTQQYVNNLLINNQELTGSEDSTVPGNKDYADKIREIRYSVAIENEMTKDEILEGYLNLVLFSGREYGVQAAAQRFYSVDAKDLNLQQSAMLAGMVQLPNVYNPLTNPERSKDRRDKVLGNMLRAGAITREEYDEAVASDLETDPSVAQSGCIAAGDSGHFCDYVSRLITSDEAFGKTKEDRTNLLYRGGLTIKTTLDSSAQKVAAKEARKMVDPSDDSNLGTAIVSVEPGTGNILAMAQNKYYNPEVSDENSEFNFSVSRALGGSGGFQGGSTLKPYTTLAWLHEGHNMWDKVDTSLRAYSTSYNWKASCLPGGSTRVGSPWTPQNAVKYPNSMTVADGLYWSVNSATIREASQVDLCTITDYLTKLGVLNHEPYKNEDGETVYEPRPISPQYPSFVIGGSGQITPLSQAAAFAAFANKGKYCEPRALTSVTDADGTEYKVKGESCEQVIDEQIVADMNGTLQKIATQRVSKGRVPGPIAGKTGTNNKATSTWFVGYTTGMSTAAWVGRHKDQGLDVRNTTVNGQRYGWVDSATFAAPLWTNYMSQVAGNYERESFGNARSAPKPKPSPKPQESDDSDDSSPSSSPSASANPQESDNDSGGNSSERPEADQQGSPSDEDED